EAAPAGATDQSRRPGEEIAKLVAELALVARVDVLHRGVAVLPEGRGADEVEAKGVGAVDVDHVERLDDVPERLRDLPVVEREIAVHEELPWNAIAGRQQQRRPEDGVEAQDVLREVVAHRGPVALDQVLSLAGVRD